MSVVSSLPSLDVRPSVIGSTLLITGSIDTGEDLEIRGTVRGHIAVPNHCVRVESGARVEADVLARDLTVCGQARGKLTGTEIVDIRAGARVDGQIAAPRVALDEGAVVNARVETRSVDAAVRVAQYRKQR